MSWIKTIPYEDADRGLKRIYDRVKGPDGALDNILMVHSLRPHTLTGHMYLYKNVLHNSNNTLPKWYLELIGVCVSAINLCDYCVEHHLEGLRRLIGKEKADTLHIHLNSEELSNFLDEKYVGGIHYARILTTNPSGLKKSDLEKLNTSGFTEGEILEINQVAAYFNYANRTVLGLGVSLKGDVLGLSPNESSDPDNWSHK